MNLKQLEYFRVIAELEHFTKASEKLLISQSSLSHSIKELETELGVELFRRQGRNVKMTKYGQMFLPYVEQSLDILNEGCKRLRDDVDPNTGTINISIPPSLVPFISYLTVRYFSETGRTNVNFKINQVGTYDEISQQVMNGDVDLAFSTIMESPDIGKVQLGYHEMVLVVSKTHRMARRKSIDLRDVDGERFIAFPHSTQIRRNLDEVFSELNVNPKIAVETVQDNVMYGLVAAGHGVAIVPRPLGTVPYNIKVLPIENSRPEPRVLFLLWNKKGYLPPAALRFMDFVESHGFIFDEYLLEM